MIKFSYGISDFYFLFELIVSGEKARQMSIEEIKALEPVKQKLAESKKQLLDYQSRLASKYGDLLRLQLISVVAVGFERVVWCPVQTGGGLQNRL